MYDMGQAHLHRATGGLLLVLAVFGLQGCLAIMWAGAVSYDVARTSHIEFHAFENSSVIGPEEQQRLASLTSIAVMKFSEDPAMAERWAAVLQQATTLRVIGPEALREPGHAGDEEDRMAQRITREQGVDCVLFGRVVRHERTSLYGGLKERISQTLYLHLIAADGRLLWKTELPFTVLVGAKALEEPRAIQALLVHVCNTDEVAFKELVLKHERTLS